MSRIGNMPIILPAGVTLSMSNHDVAVAGAKGQLTVHLPEKILVKQADNHVTVVIEDTSIDPALHGLTRVQIANAVTGVDRGWSKMLELSGVGFRAVLEGQNLVLTVGFSHPVKITPPAGIIFTISEGKIVVSGIDKQLVGQVAASIRAVKKPEPYKGKGIKYVGEYIRKKAGKSAKAIGGAPGATK